jgi:hypothetical protein
MQQPDVKSDEVLVAIDARLLSTTSHIDDDFADLDLAPHVPEEQASTQASSDLPDWLSPPVTHLATQQQQRTWTPLVPASAPSTAPPPAAAASADDAPKCAQPLDDLTWDL